MSRLIRAGVGLLVVAVLLAALPSTVTPLIDPLDDPDHENYWLGAERVDPENPDADLLQDLTSEVTLTADSADTIRFAEVETWRAPARLVAFLHAARNGSANTTDADLVVDLRRLDRHYAFYVVNGTYYDVTVVTRPNETVLYAPQQTRASVLARVLPSRLVDGDTLRTAERRLVEHIIAASRNDTGGLQPRESAPSIGTPLLVALDGELYYVHRTGHVDRFGPSLLVLLSYLGAGLCLFTGTTAILTGGILTLHQRA